jgi:predicted TIM-barrel fold metal-dependent hydrolase
MKPLVIDCHAQVGSGETWAEPRRQVDYPLEQVLACAAEAGIDRSCIMAPKNDSYEEKNKEIARLSEKYPEKLIGFAVHNPQQETGRLAAMLREEVQVRGLQGVKSDGHPTRELLDVVAELKIPVIYYPELRAEAGPARMFYMMASVYPSVNFILPHLGSYRSADWWAHIETIDLAKRYPNVYVETSGAGSHKYLEMAAHDLPAEKILFGSYSPELDSRVEIHAVQLLKQPNPQEAQILGGNMQRLLGR